MTTPEEEEIALLEWMASYIRSTEEKIDGEWGYVRDFSELYAAGEVPKEYDLIVARIDSVRQALTAKFKKMV